MVNATTSSPMMAISGVTGIDRSTLTEIVCRLVQRKLLQRRRARKDARSYAINLTDETRRVLRTAERLAGGWISKFLTYWRASGASPLLPHC
jgi:DNA-binding MarR family transcriptional regulator